MAVGWGGGVCKPTQPPITIPPHNKTQHSCIETPPPHKIPTHNKTQHSCNQTRVHINNKTTNVPVFYMYLTINGSEACNIHYSGHLKGWAMESSNFLASSGIRFTCSHFRYGVQQILNFQGPPLPMPLVMHVARIKQLLTATNKQQVPYCTLIVMIVSLKCVNALY
jgi:hypothetical protein